MRENLRRVESLDGRIGAFQLVRGEMALVEAETLSARTELAELAGVPVPIKDNLPFRESRCVEALQPRVPLPVLPVTRSFTAFGGRVRCSSGSHACLSSPCGPRPMERSTA